MRFHRSLLYVPGANERALEKVFGLGADGVILDLEDSIAPQDKEKARHIVFQKAQLLKDEGKHFLVRVNALTTPWGEDDLAMAAHTTPPMLLLPKVKASEDVFFFFKKFHASGGKNLPFFVMIETPLAFLNAQEIAQKTRDKGLDLRGFVLGLNDLARETGIFLTAGREAFLSWMRGVILVAKAFDLEVLDGVFNSYKNLVGFSQECIQAKHMGMTGKTLIHPDQIRPCHEAFSPSEEELLWAHKVVQAFLLPENKEAGVLSLEGQMVERLHLTIAQRILAYATIEKG